MSFFIIYPRGDRNRISVVEIPIGLSYELDDYAVASRREFTDDEETEAFSYARKLAKENGKIYEGTDADYLD